MSDVPRPKRYTLVCRFSLPIFQRSRPGGHEGRKDKNDMITNYNTPNHPVIIGLDHGYGVRP